MTVFVVTGDAMDYDDTAWVEDVVDSLDMIPQEIAIATLIRPRNGGPYRKQTYSVDEWDTSRQDFEGDTIVRSWIYDGEWHSRTGYDVETGEYGEWTPPVKE